VSEALRQSKVTVQERQEKVVWMERGKVVRGKARPG
jgi:hypothetical protein